MNRALTHVENIIMCGAFVGAFAIGTMQVILRYVFNTGFVWTEFALVTLTIIAALMGGSRAISEGLHIRVSLFTDKLPRAVRIAVDSIAVVLTVAYCGFIAYAGHIYIEFLRRTGAVSVQSGIPLWIVYGVVPIAMCFFIVRYLQRLPNVLREGETSAVNESV